MGAGATRGGEAPYGRGAALALGAALAAVAWDPSAPAADAKRALGLAVGVAALAMGISRMGRGGENEVGAKVPAAAALWLGFVAWSAATLAWGAPSGVGTLGSWVGASALLLTSLRLPRALSRRAAGIAAAATGGASAILALAQAASGARGIAVHGGHGNPNWLGLVLAIALPLSIDLAAELRRASSKMWVLAAGAAMLEVPALLLSRSRTAWIATLVALALWISVRRGARGGGRTIAAAVVALTIVAFGAAAQASDPDEPAIESARGAEDTPIAEALEGRAWIWRASADAAFDGLPFGEGLGAFAHAFLDAQGARLAALPPKLASRRFANATTAHCDWIEVTVDSGLPALALLGAAVAAGLAAFVRERRGAEAAALAAFAICAAGDSPMRQPGAVFLLALLLGACPTARPHAKDADPPSARARRPLRLPYPRVAFALTLGCSALLLAAAASTWLGARRLTKARDGLLPDARLPVLASAARIDPRSGEAALALGLAKLELGDPAGALPDLERSRALLANIGTDVAIGNAHAAMGAPDRAAAAYRRALARHPGSFRAHVNLADALAKLRAFDEAEAHIAVARALWPGHPKLAAVAERARKARVEAEADRDP